MTETPEDRSVKERSYVRAAGLEWNAQLHAISTDTCSKIYVHRIDHRVDNFYFFRIWSDATPALQYTLGRESAGCYPAGEDADGGDSWDL